MPGVHKWGFTGQGKWSAPDGAHPWIQVLGYYNVPLVDGSKFDPWDPAALSALHACFLSSIQASVSDPYVVGWSVNNEEPDLVNYITVATVLSETTGIPGKKALVNYALSTFYDGSLSAMAAAWGVSASTVAELYTQALSAPTGEQEALREYYENQYFHAIHTTIKSIDPHHLYFGDWATPGWWYSPNDWNIIAANCDVVGYDVYTSHFADDGAPQYALRSGKPMLIGEFSFPPTYDTERGFGQFENLATTDADAGASYKQWITDATASPSCVGVCWFEYHDEPNTGRGPGRGAGIVYGENYAFGALDITDQPKWDLVNQMAAVNVNATSMRVAATAAAGPYIGKGWVIPGTVDADNYDTGGQGVGYNSNNTTNLGGQYRTGGVGIATCDDTVPGGNGYYVGWTYPGNWLRFTVNVAVGGRYSFLTRESCDSSGGALHLTDIHGTNLSGSVSLPGTGGWQNWTTVTTTIKLPAGRQVLYLWEDTGGYNLEYIAFAAPPAPTELNASAAGSKIVLTWNASAGATSYDIYRGTASKGESPTPHASGQSTTSYTDTGVDGNTTYFYTVAGVNAAGVGLHSAQAHAALRVGSSAVSIRRLREAGKACTARTGTTSSAIRVSLTRTIRTMQLYLIQPISPQ